MGRIQKRSDAVWLRLIHSAAEDSSRVRLTGHARERMQRRKISMREVLTVPRKGRFEEPPAPAVSPPGHWTARLAREGIAVALGFDPQGDPIVLDVITVMRDH